MTRRAMNGRPWAIFNSENEYAAQCKYAEDAAALIAVLGEGSEIRWDGVPVWREGKEAQAAAESYDFVAQTVHERIA